LIGFVPIISSFSSQLNFDPKKISRKFSQLIRKFLQIPTAPGCDGMAWHRPASSASAAALRPRAEAALRALAEGRRKLAHGQEAVQQLLQDLEDLVGWGLGLGLGRFLGEWKTIST
jgi:hypothetical protein